MYTILSLVSAGLILIGVATDVSETARVGGSGGRRTVSMDCGSGAFMVGISAEGGRDNNVFGWNLVRRLRFTCRRFSGTTAVGGDYATVAVVADQAAVANTSNARGSCVANTVLRSVEFRAEMFIDRVHSAECQSESQSQQYIDLNVGGDGGSRQFIACPIGEALYKVEAKAGDAIDSLKGFCRSFGSIAATSVPSQINASYSPQPTADAPLMISARSSRTITFTIVDFTRTPNRVSVGVTAVTDLLSGGPLNSPEYLIELLNPAGNVVGVRNVSHTPNDAVIQSVTRQFDANGQWKLRITNQKTSGGTLAVRTFNAFADLPSR